VSGYIGARRTLLVVDDHPTQRQMLAGMLLPLGFRIREAASGRECLESVLEKLPDAVLLDISMDDMDGWETARRIRAQGLAELPIIMVSANAFENQLDKLAKAGCQGFVDKPVIESQLLAELQRHLELEWVAELALPTWAALTPQHAMRLPEEHARTLIRLARLGHRQGLQHALDLLVEQHPDCEAQAAMLRVLVEHFAWNELVDQLSRALEFSDAEMS
jgi:CheY-like chemotaxis protein